MKKLLMVALFAIVAVGASAQKNWTIWWGGNVADVSMDDPLNPKSSFKALNIGVSYTAPIADAFDWSAGVGYVTKGFKDWDPGFIQLEGNAAWNFVTSDEAKVGIFTGPYLGFAVSDDDADMNTVDFGWQGGVVGSWKFLSLKLGYEYGFCNIVKEINTKPGEFFFRIGFRF